MRKPFFLVGQLLLCLTLLTEVAEASPIRSLEEAAEVSQVLSFQPPADVISGSYVLSEDGLLATAHENSVELFNTDGTLLKQWVGLFARDLIFVGNRLYANLYLNNDPSIVFRWARLDPSRDTPENLGIDGARAVLPVCDPPHWITAESDYFRLPDGTLERATATYTVRWIMRGSECRLAFNTRQSAHLFVLGPSGKAIKSWHFGEDFFKIFPGEKPYIWSIVPVGESWVVLPGGFVMDPDHPTRLKQPILTEPVEDDRPVAGDDWFAIRLRNSGWQICDTQLSCRPAPLQVPERSFALSARPSMNNSIGPLYCVERGPRYEASGRFKGILLQCFHLKSGQEWKFGRELGPSEVLWDGTAAPLDDETFLVGLPVRIYRMRGRNEFLGQGGYYGPWFSGGYGRFAFFMGDESLTIGEVTRRGLMIFGVIPVIRHRLEEEWTIVGIHSSGNVIAVRPLYPRSRSSVTPPYGLSVQFFLRSGARPGKNFVQHFPAGMRVWIEPNTATYSAIAERRTGPFIDWRDRLWLMGIRDDKVLVALALDLNSGRWVASVPIGKTSPIVEMFLMNGRILPRLFAFVTAEYEVSQEEQRWPTLFRPIPKTRTLAVFFDDSLEIRDFFGNLLKRYSCRKLCEGLRSLYFTVPQNWYLETKTGLYRVRFRE
jgi:hypothetical protein